MSFAQPITTVAMPFASRWRAMRPRRRGDGRRSRAPEPLVQALASWGRVMRSHARIAVARRERPCARALRVGDRRGALGGEAGVRHALLELDAGPPDYFFPAR